MDDRLTLTKRQLGAGAGILIAIMSIGQLKEIKEFFVGDTAATIVRIEIQQKEGFDRLERALRASDSESVVRLRRLKDTTWLEIGAAEARCVKRADELKADLTTLQAYAFKTRPTRGSQN